MSKLIPILISTLLISVSSLAAITPDGTYQLDKDHANIGFSISHFGISDVIGRFNKFSGSVNFQAGGQSEVSFSIEAASVDTNQAKRDAHIKREDLFDVATFPTIDFKSTEITYDSEGDPSTITGDLNFRGETKSVIFNVEKVGAGKLQGKQRAGYKAFTSISRSEFGMTALRKIVGDEVNITVNLEIIKD